MDLKINQGDLIYVDGSIRKVTGISWILVPGSAPLTRPSLSTRRLTLTERADLLSTRGGDPAIEEQVD